MNTDSNIEMTAIKALDLLFYNYDKKMLDRMLENSEFNYVWNTYIETV